MSYNSGTNTNIIARCVHDTPVYMTNSFFISQIYLYLSIQPVLLHIVLDANQQ